MKKHATWGIGIAAIGWLVACGQSAEKTPPAGGSSASAAAGALAPPAEINPRLLRRFKAITSDAPPSKPLVELGRKLFHDARLSLDGDVSCASCHAIASFGVDGRRTSTGHKGIVGDRNAPTVLNATFAFSQFWDGRAATIEDQAKGPILNPKEMAMPSGDAVIARLAKVAGYKKEFATAYPDEREPMTFDNVSRAIGAYEHQLVTPSRWDRFLAGETNALDAKEKAGLKTFLNVGCMVCHTGPLLGGTTFERVGVVEPWPNQTDVGRMAITKSNADRMMFKVPTLRNIAKTAPYFHDGSAGDLPEAIRMMGRHQLGLELSAQEVDGIAAWMGALTGNVSAELGPPESLPE